MRQPVAKQPKGYHYFTRNYFLHVTNDGLALFSLVPTPSEYTAICYTRLGQKQHSSDTNKEIQEAKKNQAFMAPSGFSYIPSTGFRVQRPPFSPTVFHVKTRRGISLFFPRCRQPIYTIQPVVEGGRLMATPGHLFDTHRLCILECTTAGLGFRSKNLFRCFLCATVFMKGHTDLEQRDNRLLFFKHTFYDNDVL